MRRLIQRPGLGKKVGLFVGIAVMFMPLWAQDPKPEGTQNYIADEVVAIVGNSHILLSDVERTIQQVIQLRREEGLPSERPVRDEAFESILLQKLLSEQGRLDSLTKDLGPASDVQVELEIQRMIAAEGSVKALEKKYGKEIFGIKEDLLKQVEESQLSQMMQREITSKIKINYPEVAAFMATIPMDSMEMVPEQYVYAQIVRMPPATEERRFAVRQQLLEYRERVLNGESMRALASMYSMDPNGRRLSGEWGPDDINKLVYPVVEALESLKPGNVSEIIETEYGFHIVELLSLKDDLVHFRQILLKPTFTLEEQEQEKKLLDSIAKVVGTDEKAFHQAVLDYSMDVETAQNGGLVYNARAAKVTGDTRYASPRFMKDALQPQDYRPLSLLKEGEVSPAYEAIDDKGNTVYKIVRLNEVIPAHYASLAQDFEAIAEFALIDKQNKYLDHWINTVGIPNMYIWISPEYRDVEFERNWLKK